MRLRNHILLWVSLTSLVPLAILVLGATLYSEHRYRSQVAEQVQAGLTDLTAEIERQLYYEREMVRALSASEPMRAFLPVLDQASQGDLHPEYFGRAARLNRFLEGFQSVVPGFGTLRVLDMQANTLIRVRIGHADMELGSGIESLPYAEESLEDPAFARRLAHLPRDEISFVAPPERPSEVPGGAQGEVRPPSLLSAVVPLHFGGRRAGYLLADLSGNQLDHILELAAGGPRLIAELNPEQPGRDGLVLYDDLAGVLFARPGAAPLRLRDRLPGLAEAVQSHGYGELRIGDEDIHFVEYLPYPASLASWVVAARVDPAEVTAPFARIRYAILSFAAAVVLFALGLAQLGARSLARPIVDLARTLQRYADGDHRARVRVEGAEELRQLEGAFNYMAETLERARHERDRAQNLLLHSAKLASIGEMAAGIGHEINNPLNNILSLTRLMERATPPEQAGLRSDLQSLREEAMRASAIVRGILDFAHQRPPSYSRFDGRQWLQEGVELVRRTAARAGVRLDGRAPEGCTLEGDRAQLQQVLVNLLLNAVQASPPGGRVEVTLACGAQGVELRVRDHGTGIPDGALDRIFDPFFTTKEVGEGSGLGLSISLGLVERHGGRLEIRNHPGGGVEARMVLPPARALLEVSDGS